VRLRLVEPLVAEPDPRRDLALRLADVALRAVDAEGATAAALRSVRDLPADAFLLAVGKASVPMARAALRAVPRARGFLIGLAPLDPVALGSIPDRLTCFAGTHPLPSPDAPAQARAILDAAEALTASDVALCLVSGGGSSLLELPKDGLTLDDVRHLTRDGMAGGLPIGGLNALRATLSAVKGGKLGAAMRPARIVNVFLSDIVDGTVAQIASGPTVHPDAEDHLAADNRTAIDAVVEAAASLGVRLVSDPEIPPGAPPLPPYPLTGEACVSGARWMAACAARLAADPSIDGVVTGGETTVTLTGDGEGGRNGEIVLGAIPHLGEHLVLSLATDGADGSSGSAGALIDAAGVALGTALAGPPNLALATNDSARWLRTAGLLLDSGGPTGTNVADVQIVLR